MLPIPEWSDSSTDQLEISALRVKTHIGVHAWEQRILQDVLFDIRIPIHRPMKPDKLQTTLDYDALCKQITAAVKASSFQLIETLAEYVADLIKQQYPEVNTVFIRVSKPHAVPGAGNISIQIQR